MLTSLPPQAAPDRAPLKNVSLHVLSHREREVLRLMALGYSNQGICAELFLSPKTVETHVRNIFIKLGLRGTAESNRRVLAVLSYIAGAATAFSIAA